MSLPTTMKALVENDAETGGVVSNNVPVPTLQAGDILVKVSYAGQNPTDWKHAAYISKAGDILGCDFAGVVAHVQDGEARVKVGDRVAGSVHGGKFKDRGSYAEYLRVPADLVWKVPDSVQLQDAAALGVALGTSIQAIIQSQGNPFPPANVDRWYFIYGGSTGVGLVATKLAKLIGFKVATVASPRNFDLVKSYGADEVFDYREGADAVVANVLRVTGGGVTQALDTISEGESQAISARVFAPAGGQLNLTLVPDATVAAAHPNIKFVPKLMYTWMSQEPFDIAPRFAKQPVVVPVIPGDREFYAKALTHYTDLVERGVRPPPVVLRGGLDDVLAGFKDMADGKVSGERYVYKL
ncbi:Protein TOXD [Vanrija pseudolonga]|uniref:Protein TOXD n=1 Tax=Vanrija pseudolonga TaxID=143232 RepID=A0AAF1BK69_9TREE|nr:Protein TOXD [Vanrija pseudolonga]